MMGIHTTKPFVTFTEHGFPKELIDELEQRFGKKIVGNKSASGTEILEELAEQEIYEDKVIVYTSADSVLQICGNEDTMGLDTLYRYCEIARELTMKDEWRVGRIIARPYVGKKKGEFKRTSNRHDYALKPTGRTVLNSLKDAGFEVISVGKINDIFAGKGITEYVYTTSNADGMDKMLNWMDRDFNGLCFVNLVDFDMLYGHRQDAVGYANAINEFDKWLTDFLPRLGDDDLLMIPADHGCDPSDNSTDHTREYTPLLIYGKGVAPVNYGTRECFADISATVAELLGVEFDGAGKAIEL